MKADDSNADILRAWQRTLQQRADRCAIIETATGWQTTFAELERDACLRAEAIAQALGEVRRRVVAFSLPNGAEWLGTFLALRKLGAVAVALEATTPVVYGHEQASKLGACGWIEAEGKITPLSGRRQFRSRDIGLLKLTSGSTGEPRAVAFTDGQMLADGRQVARTMDIRADDVNFALIPFGHSYGLGNLVMPLLGQGTSIVCGSSPLPHAIAAEVAQHQPTVFPTVPAVLRALVASGIAGDALTSLRTIISAGSHLPPETAREFRARFGRVVHNFYGSSETGGIAYDRSGEATLTGRAVGSAMQGVTIRVMARSRRVEVKSAAVFTYRNPQPGRVLLADHGKLNANGELVLLGRTTHFVKIGGRRVGFGEIERTLRELPGVAQAFVTTIPGSEPVLTAVVATQSDPGEIRAALQVRLPGWKIPRRLVCLPEFPLTPRGKPDTRALQALLEQTRGDQS